jgi:endogenous inhibitor of DNA gyrase (YacG/DUF329 family)
MADPAVTPSAPCPICGRPSDTRHRPFCSIRCADADLGRWLTGHYRVPGPPVDPDDPSAGRLDPEDGLG